MRSFSIITVSDVVGYDGEDVITSDEPIFMNAYEGYPTFEDVLELDEIVEIVESKKKGESIKIFIDYMEYLPGKDDENESVDDIVDTLTRIMDALDDYLDQDLIKFADADDGVITIEDPASINSSVVELDLFE